jgi:predicted metal-binding membrane protein
MAAAVLTGRAVVVASLAAVTALSWAYLVAMAAHGMGPMDAMAPIAWSSSYAASMLLMWVLMMVAMMLPSALPMVLILDRFSRARAQGSGLDTALFTSGYVLVWAGFSVLATAAQWGLERSGLLSAHMALTSGEIAAGVFIAAGAWQFTPIKRTCLDACRSPIEFLSSYWRPGRTGPLLMGLHHGAFCLGCCWVLMALLFVGGVMNLLWIVPVALFVLIEKCLPGGERMGKVGGAPLIVWGAAALFFVT